MQTAPTTMRMFGIAIGLIMACWPALAMAECVEPRCCFVNDDWAVMVTLAVFTLIFVLILLAFPELLFFLRSSATFLRAKRRLNLPENIGVGLQHKQ